MNYILPIIQTKGFKAEGRRIEKKKKELEKRHRKKTRKKTDLIPFQMQQVKTCSLTIRLKWHQGIHSSLLVSSFDEIELLSLSSFCCILK